MPGPASAALLDALQRRPALAVTGRQAWEALQHQADGDAAERWAEGVLDLLHANAGVVCLTAFLRLQGSAGRLADVARDVAEVCRDAGASAAVAAIEAWAALPSRAEASDLWPGLRRLAREAPDCVPLAAGHAGRIMTAVGRQGFSAFVALGLKSAGRDKARRTAFFALTDPAALHALAQGEGGGFAAQERGLRLFATALAGRMPALRPLPVAAGRPPARRASLSDGVLLLPETFPGVPQSAQARLFRAATAHALAHLMAGALRQPVGQLKPMQLAVIGALEDARVEALALRRFPGLRRLWAPYHVAIPEGITAPALLARLSRALFDPDYADPHGFVGKARALFAVADPLDPRESRRIGGLLGNDLGQMRVQFNARDYVVEPGYRDDGLGLWDFGEQPDAPPDIIEMMVEAARLRQEEGEGRPDQQQLPEAAEGRARAAVGAPESVLLARYPEWDRQQGVERPDWTAVRAGPAPMGDVRQLEAALAGLSDLRRRIDRLVRAARPGRPQRLKRQPDGMELDMDAVVDAQVAQAAGALPDARVFRTTTLQTRDLATVVLVDVSASTRLDRVLEIERIAVALLAEAMAGLGDPFALLAFASDGREQVQLTRIKSFGEPFGHPARARLAGLSSGLSTRLGAALRHAGSEIAGVRSFRRLVLVLTDGEPSDIDVPDPLDLVEDSRRALLGLRAQGIDAFAVVLGAEGAETAARIFGRSGCVTVRTMDDLPARLSDLYFRLSRR
jgi:nitric oxide reductase NorD protein